MLLTDYVCDVYRRDAALCRSLYPVLVAQAEGAAAAQLGPYTILPSKILYGVWRTKGGSAGGRILRDGREIVLQ